MSHMPPPTGPRYLGIEPPRRATYRMSRKAKRVRRIYIPAAFVAWFTVAAIWGAYNMETQGVLF